MLRGDCIFDGQIVALEPRTDSRTFETSTWPSCRLLSVHGGTVSIQNDTLFPIHVPKHDQVAQIRSTKSVDVPNKSTPTPKKTLSTPRGPFSSAVIVDPSNQLSPEWRTAFRDLHLSYDSVFEDVIGRYNDALQ